MRISCLVFFVDWGPLSIKILKSIPKDSCIIFQTLKRNIYFLPPTCIPCASFLTSASNATALGSKFPGLENMRPSESSFSLIPYSQLVLFLGNISSTLWSALLFLSYSHAHLASISSPQAQLLILTIWLGLIIPHTLLPVTSSPDTSLCLTLSQSDLPVVIKACLARLVSLKALHCSPR